MINRTVRFKKGIRNERLFLLFCFIIFVGGFGFFSYFIINPTSLSLNIETFYRAKINVVESITLDKNDVEYIQLALVKQVKSNESFVILLKTYEKELVDKLNSATKENSMSITVSKNDKNQISTKKYNELMHQLARSNQYYQYGILEVSNNIEDFFIVLVFILSFAGGIFVMKKSKNSKETLENIALNYPNINEYPTGVFIGRKIEITENKLISYNHGLVIDLTTISDFEIYEVYTRYNRQRNLYLYANEEVVHHIQLPALRKKEVQKLSSVLDDVIHEKIDGVAYE